MKTEVTLKVLREVATAALKLAIPLSAKTGWEFGGVIYRRDDRFQFTSPHTSREKDALDILPAVSKVVGSALPDELEVWRALELFEKFHIVSVYHTHPCMTPLGIKTSDPKWARLGSFNDMSQLVMADWLATYIGVVCTGEVIELTQDLPPVFPIPGKLIPAAQGPVIGYIPV